MIDAIEALSQPVSQAEFSRIVGRTPGRVSQWAADGTLEPDGTALEWLHAVMDRLSGEAAGRYSAGELDLTQERAALARSQREVIDLKAGVLRGEYAKIELLAQVLAAASQAVAQRFDLLPSQVRKACPLLPPQAVDVVMSTIASARNEWVRQTAELVVAAVATIEDGDEP